MSVARTKDAPRPALPDRNGEWTAYRAQIVAAANRVGAQLSGCGIDAVRFLTATHDVVFAVWQDRREPDGVGTMLIKGQQAMREVIADGESRAVSLTAIPCRSSLEAQALRETIGETDARH